MKDRNIKILIIASIAIIGISIMGGTYAYLTMGVNVVNGTYNNVGTYCLDINYSVNNVDNTQDITGTLFPSGTINKGLNGRVGIKTASGCAPTAKGLLKLHVDGSTDPQLTTPASSYCESRSTLEPLTEYTTESACTTAGGRWRGYGDPYCENPNTLERLLDYTTESDCNSHSGSWTSGGSPLKYAVFNTTEANATPVSVGKINTTDIGREITIYNDFTITTTQAYYYIYIWLDGYLTDNTHTSLPFVGSINAEAGLTELEPPSPYVYAVNTEDVKIGQSIPNNITTYSTPEAAMAALKEIGEEDNYPYFLRYKLESGIVTEGYVGLTVTQEMVSGNSGMTAGTYYLRGIGTYDSDDRCIDQYLDSNTGQCVVPYYDANKTILQNAFGAANCSGGDTYFSCSALYLTASLSLDGDVEIFNESSWCQISGYSGNFNCHE